MLMISDNPIPHLNMGNFEDNNRSSMNSDQIQISRIGNESPTKLSIQSLPVK
jgi:hypothetical protein